MPICWILQQPACKNASNSIIRLMGVPIKGASDEFSSNITSCDFPSSGGKHVTPSARDWAPKRRNKKQTGKLSRSRRLPGRATKKHSQRSSHQHWNHQQPGLGPVSDNPSLRHGTSLPILVHPLRSIDGMLGTSSQVDRLGAPAKNDCYPASPRSLMHSASSTPVQQVPVPCSVGDCGSSQGSVYDQEQQVIRRRLEDLLARPPPSFDYMIPDNHGSHDRDSPFHRARDTPASSTLPELVLSRSGHRNVSGSQVTPALDEVKGKPFREGRRRGSGSTAAEPIVKSSTTSRRTKPTRSQSGGHLRPGNSSGGAAAVRGRESAPSADAGPTKHTTAVKSFEGADVALLEEAFAFAERSAKEEEEEAERQESLAPREGRKPRRDGRGFGLGVQLHRGEKGGRLRRTNSSGGEVAGVGAGGRIEVEDWVRGLPGSSPQALSQRQLKHQQRASSITQAPHHHSDRPGAAGTEQQARTRRREKLAISLRKKEAKEEASTLRFDRRRETEGKKRTTATVELVERFENGTGVSALKTELEESQAAMRRSAEAFQQVASQWHQQRLMLPPPAGDR